MVESRRGYNAVVVGVGAVGSATAYHLARRGASVLGIERHGVPNGRGSSRGFTRLTNPVFREDPEYVPLVERSLELWEDLQETHPRRLVEQTGAVRGWPSAEYTGREGTLDDARRLCEDHALSHEVLTAAELGTRYPGYDFPAGYRFLLTPEGGLLDPQECIIAHVNRAHAHGAEIRAHERVEAWEETTDGVCVRTDRGEYAADDLVVTAGPWLGDLVGGTRETFPQRAVVGWFRPEKPEQFTPETFPAFSVDTEEGDFYGTPAHRLDGVKVGGRTTPMGEEPAVDPDTADRTVSRAEEADLRAFLSSYFDGAAGPTLRLVGCIVTRSADGQYILDSHPAHPNVHVAGGFTGTGFMTASAVGEALAELALDGSATLDVSRFEIDASSG